MNSIDMGVPDYIKPNLDLDNHLIQHPSATFFMRVEGRSNCDIGILHGDLLIVDRALTPRNKDIVVAIEHGELKVKRFINNKYLEVWGVVTYAIHDVRFARI